MLPDRLQSDAERLLDSEERFRLLVESVRDYAIFMLDARGHVLTWNVGAQRIKGYAAHEIIGQHFSRFYPPDALARELPAHELEMAAATGSFEDEGWRLRRDGSRFWANVVITAMRDASGALLGFSKVTRDLTQRRQQEEALRQSEERFRLLVEGVADYAIFMLDANGYIATWNAGAQRIKGYAAQDIIGRHFSTFYPQEARDSRWPEHELQVAAEVGRFVDEGWRLRRDGTRFWANVTITAMRDAAGTLLGFAKLTRDLTETKRAEAAEQASQEREQLLESERSARMSAQHATRLKDEFLATLSHELRTPLSAILGWTQVLLRTGLDELPPRHRHALEVIDRNARSQVQLIDELLDLSRILAGKVRLDMQEICLNDLVRAAIDSALPSAQAKELALEARLATATIRLRGDPARLQQVVWNLLTNAVKFTPRGGRIEVTLERPDGHARLCVRDDGIGIPASFLPQVFDRFSQQDSSATRAFGGLGLGLAITRELVELHNGTIAVASPGEGLGASFTVTLPVAASVPAAAEGGTDAAGARDGGEEFRLLPQLQGAHVVLVDDETDARELLEQVFADQGARVSAFATAEEALAVLQHTRPDLIVSDIGMPHMDGLQFIRQLRAGEARGERIPALALTAFARAEDRKRALLAGFQSHVAKPFDVGELLLVAAGLVGR